MMLKINLNKENEMIKGVTKNIIEINPRNHDYFEKLIIILKNEPDTLNIEEIHKCAFLMAGQKPPSCIHDSGEIIKMILCILIGVVSTLICCGVTVLFV